MSITDEEQAFLDKIDCKFPYLDASKAAALIEEARSISSNAAFCLLYEIVCPPASEELSKQTQKELLAMWIDNSICPLAVSIANLAGHVLDGKTVPTEQVLIAMREVASFQGQYGALAAISHIAYAGRDGVDCEVIDTLEQEIKTQWNNA